MWLRYGTDLMNFFVKPQAGQSPGPYPPPLLTGHEALQGAAGRPQELPPAGLPLGRL